MSDTLLRKIHSAEVKSLGARQVRFCISTADVDRDDDVINQSGWDLSNYRKNPVVLWAHSHTDLPVGKCVEIGVVNGKLMATVEFATHPFAETVYQMVLGRFLNATSVGFRALESEPNRARGGVDFQRQELMEFSITPCPANPHALVAASAAGIDTKLLRDWATKVLHADETAAEPVLRVRIDDDYDARLVSRALEPAARSGLIRVDPQLVAELTAKVVTRHLSDLIGKTVVRAVNQGRGRVD